MNVRVIWKKVKEGNYGSPYWSVAGIDEQDNLVLFSMSMGVYNRVFPVRADDDPLAQYERREHGGFKTHTILSIEGGDVTNTGKLNPVGSDSFFRRIYTETTRNGKNPDKLIVKGRKTVKYVGHFEGVARCTLKLNQCEFSDGWIRDPASGIVVDTTTIEEFDSFEYFNEIKEQLPDEDKIIVKGAGKIYRRKVGHGQYADVPVFENGDGYEVETVCVDLENLKAAVADHKKLQEYAEFLSQIKELFGKGAFLNAHEIESLAPPSHKGKATAILDELVGKSGYDLEYLRMLKGICDEDVWCGKKGFILSRNGYQIWEFPKGKFATYLFDGSEDPKLLAKKLEITQRNEIRKAKILGFLHPKVNHPIKDKAAKGDPSIMEIRIARWFDEIKSRTNLREE